LLTQLRTKTEEFFSVFSVPKPFDLLAAALTGERAAKDNFAVNRIPQRFPRHLCRSRFSIKHSGIISAERTGIFGYIAATLLVGTSEPLLACSAMTAFCGIAEDGHGIIAHFRSLRFAGSAAWPT